MSKIKNILVVTDSINIEDSSGSKANVALINNLIKAGFEVTVYHYTLKNIHLDGAKCVAISEIKFSLFYFLSRLQRVLSRSFNINLAHFFERRFGFSFTFFNDTDSIKRAIKKLDFSPDLVFTLSKGGSFRPHYAVLKIPSLHDKWVAYVHDPFPFHFYPRPYNWVEPSYKFKEDFFREVANRAKHSAFPSQLLMDWMGSYFSGFLKSGIVIPHQNLNYKAKEISLPSYFDINKFNMLHAGNLLSERSPKGLIDGFKLFLNANPDSKLYARLLLLGPATSHTTMLQEYQNALPELYVQNGMIAFDTIYALQEKTTVNIIVEAKSEISPFLPAKFPHCVNANKTILLLGPHYSETKRLLGDNYEFYAEADDAIRIAEKIGKLFQLWKQDPNQLVLNRPDLEYYLSAAQLKQTIDSL